MDQPRLCQDWTLVRRIHHFLTSRTWCHHRWPTRLCLVRTAPHDTSASPTCQGVARLRPPADQPSPPPRPRLRGRRRLLDPSLSARRRLWPTARASKCGRRRPRPPARLDPPANNQSETAMDTLPELERGGRYGSDRERPRERQRGNKTRVSSRHWIFIHCRINLDRSAHRMAVDEEGSFWAYSYLDRMLILG